MTHTPTSSGVSAEAVETIARALHVLDCHDSDEDYRRDRQTPPEKYADPWLPSGIRQLEILRARARIFLAALPAPPRPSSDTIGGGELAGWSVRGTEAYRLFHTEDEARDYAGSWGLVRPVYNASFIAQPDPSSDDKIAMDRDRWRTAAEAIEAVKPLEWRKEPIPPTGECLASTVVGLYCIPLGRTSFTLRFRDKDTLGDFATLDAAKAAAQADFNARIHSALAQDGGGAVKALTGEAITEAMQICVDLLLLAELIGDKRFGAIVTEGAVQQLERADTFLQRLIKDGLADKAALAHSTHVEAIGGGELDAAGLASAKDAFDKAMESPRLIDCPTCAGSGSVHSDWCPRCAGGGVDLADGEETRPLSAAIRAYLSALQAPQYTGVVEPVAWRRCNADEPGAWFDITLDKATSDAWKAFRTNQIIEPLYASPPEGRQDGGGEVTDLDAFIEMVASGHFYEDYDASTSLLGKARRALSALASSPHVEEETLAAVAVLRKVRDMLEVEYHDDGRVACVAHKSGGLREMVAVLDAALVPLPKPAIEARLRKALQLCVDMIVANDLETALANTLETARTALSLQGGDKPDPDTMQPDVHEEGADFNGVVRPAKCTHDDYDFAKHGRYCHCGELMTDCGD